MLQFALLFALVWPSQSQNSGDTVRQWDDLVTTWGRFDKLPRTVANATSQGFVLNTTTHLASRCKPFLGNRYVENGTGVMLLYDANGYIAGIQIGIDQNLPNNEHNYPSPLIRPPWLEYENQYILTAYFVPPATICRGRTEAEFAEEGTGRDVYLQNGPHPVRDSVKVPRQESVANSSLSLWTEGACFPSMGTHYFYNIREDMSCDELFPMFLLYNNGTLTAIGWLLNADVRLPRLEHFPPGSGTGLKDPPACLDGLGQLTSLHMYFTSNPAKYNKC